MKPKADYLLAPLFAVFFVGDLIDSSIKTANKLFHFLRTGHHRFEHIRIDSRYDDYPYSYDCCTTCKHQMNLRPL